MARVHFSCKAARRLTGGVTELEVEANTIRLMVLELDRRFPRPPPPDRREHGGGDRGENFQDAYLAPLRPDSDICLIPMIGGG